MVDTSTTIERAPGGREPAAAPAGDPGATTAPERRFWTAVITAVVVGGIIRFTYLFHGAPAWPRGDGFAYHVSALRLVDGLGYTEAIGGRPTAHHPPAWTTLLATVTAAGGRSMRVHQAVGIGLGLGLIVLVALVGRRYVSRRVGAIAALLAALYPGFWVLEAQILSEPLGLVVLAVLLLALAALHERPTLAGAAGAGAATGALALVRSEQFALLVLAVVPIILLHRRTDLRRRLASTGVAVAVALAMIAPWALYNAGRFEEPVLLSSNAGTTLLAGNCAPGVYEGDLIGHYVTTCSGAVALRHRDYDRSQLDRAAREVALDNASDNVRRLPATVLARHGRVLGVFRPSQTVDLAATWLGSATWPVWLWVASFWVLVPAAVCGGLLLRRSKTFQWPLVAPVLIVLAIVTVAYGEPRYHTPADLGLVVLAAVAVERLAARRRPTPA